MAPEQQDKFDTFQSHVIWIAISCFACKFLLDGEEARKMFGSIWLNIKEANGVIMWLAAIISGKKFVDLFDYFKKAMEQIKQDKGNVPD